MSVEVSNSPQSEETPLHHEPISPTSAMSRITFVDQQLAIEDWGKPFTTIEPGTYVAFAIAKQCLAMQFPEGSEAHQTILKFQIHRYVGLVVSSHTHRTEDGNVQELVIYFATKASLPSLSVADHRLPISSVTSKSESDRPPLQTTTFFPWVDCMQLTTLGIKAFVDDIHESPLKFTLEHEEYDRFEEAAAKDYEDFDAKEESLSLEDRANIRRLEDRDCTVPIELWMDIRLGDVKANPFGFADGVDALEW
jgi:hypothetical protein